MSIRRIDVSLIGALIANLLLVPPVFAKSSCAPARSAQEQVVSALRTMFEAARTDDMSKFNSIADPEFYAYDGGRTFSGPSLMSFIQQAHANGKVYEWNVTEPKVHVSCNTAWVTYVNRGSVQDSSGRESVTWLESANLDYSRGRWLIRFLHSTRAPAQP